MITVASECSHGDGPGWTQDLAGARLLGALDLRRGFSDVRISANRRLRCGRQQLFGGKAEVWTQGQVAPCEPGLPPASQPGARGREACLPSRGPFRRPELQRGREALGLPVPLPFVQQQPGLFLPRVPCLPDPCPWRPGEERPGSSPGSKDGVKLSPRGQALAPGEEGELRGPSSSWML